MIAYTCRTVANIVLLARVLCCFYNAIEKLVDSNANCSYTNPTATSFADEQMFFNIVKKQCPGDGIGIRVGLRSQILRVRVSPWAPYLNVLEVANTTRCLHRE